MYCEQNIFNVMQVQIKIEYNRLPNLSWFSVYGLLIFSKENL